MKLAVRSCRRPCACRFQPLHERVAGNQNPVAQAEVGNLAAFDRSIEAAAANLPFPQQRVRLINTQSSVQLRFVHFVLFFFLQIHLNPAYNRYCRLVISSIEQFFDYVKQEITGWSN
jgi:hypothetical protein